jgi:predicted kinase
MTTPPPTLVVLRGNSGSGKTSTAREVRRRYGRGTALIEQDYLRRVVLREHGSDSSPTMAPRFITTMVREALTAGYHVVLEGILHSGTYGSLLRELIAEHPGPSSTFWMDVSFEETVRRHERRHEPTDVSALTMRSWYAPLDLLRVPGERVIAETSGFEETVAQILHDSGLAEAAALTPCPLICPRCAQKQRHTPVAVRPSLLSPTVPEDFQRIRRTPS